MCARVAVARVAFRTRPTVTATSPRFVLCAMGQVSSNRRMLRATPELDKTLYSLRQSCSGNLARVTRLENILVKRCILSDHAFQRKVLLNILADRARLEVERRYALGHIHHRAAHISRNSVADNLRYRSPRE